MVDTLAHYMRQSSPMDIAQRLKHAKKKPRWLIKTTGLSKDMVYNILSGKSKPGPEHVEILRGIWPDLTHDDALAIYERVNAKEISKKVNDILRNSIAKRCEQEASI